MRPIILNISNDFPDALEPHKTPAVKALVEGTPEFRHVVYSLNRVDGWSGMVFIPFGEDRTAVAYHALPKGLFWDKALRAVAEGILADLREKNIIPDLICAHKFTVEGLVGEFLAEAFGKPLVCNIQGGSDVKILKAKISLRGRYRAIAARAALVFPYAPWCLPVFQDLIQLERSKCVLLPVVPGWDTLSPAPFISENRLITVFNSDTWERKNLDGVMQAMKLLTSRFPDLTLDVYGRGKPASMMKMVGAVQASGLGDRVRVMGPVANDRLPVVMKDYAAFVMPSKEETFGLVYTEALFAGLPVLFSKGRGIDGYFAEARIGYASDPYAPEDIAKGIAHILVHQAELKHNIAAGQADGTFDIFRKGPILETYRAGLRRVLVV